MKYYLQQLHNTIKDHYFKYFKHLRIDDAIIKGTFTLDMFEDIRPLDVRFSVTEFKNEISDYIHLSKDDKFSCDSEVMRAYRHQLTLTEYIISTALQDEEMHLVTKEVIDILSKHCDESYLVGGAIRDILDGNIPKDFDFVTGTSYDELEKIFGRHGFTTVATGKNFLVLNVKKDGQKYEIAHFRKDGPYVDNKPEYVEIGTMEDDAQRRDFTCNAIFFNLRTYRPVDPTGLGIRDCADKILRFVGKPKDRLNEDLLRAIRAYRFIGKGYTPDGKLLTAIRDSFECMQKEVPAERVKLEIEKMVGLI